ncbi:uroporphyrinogen-III synthase [Oxalobacteraceae bacterium GrIS 2.11]
MTMNKTVVLTRPVAQCSTLAQRLGESGCLVELFPLLEIAALPVDGELSAALNQTLADLKRYTLAAFVSPNAVHAVFRQGLVWPAEVKIAVMGEGSRAALAQYGIDETTAQIFSPTDPLHSDSENLLLNLDLAGMAGQRAVIFRAETGRELLADALNARGIDVDKVIAYRRHAPSLAKEDIERLNALLTPASYWVVCSSEALRTLESMVVESAGAAAVVNMHQVNLLVSHQRIAQIAENSGFKHVQLVGLGDENVVLALQSHL